MGKFFKTPATLLSQLSRTKGDNLLMVESQALVSFKKLLQGKHLLFSPSPLRLNIFRLFVILSLTQLYCYTPEIFLFSTATFKYQSRTNWTRIFSESRIFYFSVTETDTTTSGLRWIFHVHSEFSRPAMCNNAIMIISSQM